MKAFLHRLAYGLLIVAGLAAAPRAHAAAYATGGSGRYRGEILWLTWGGGVNGTDGTVLANGDSTSATIAVTATQDLVLQCRLSNIGGGGIESYRPGDWSGDALDDMYNIGGSGGGNQLIAGIMGRSGVRTFTVGCQATLGGRPYRIPGLVMADAESLESSGNEYLQGTARGTWNVVEMHSGNGNAYTASKTAEADGRQTIRLGPGGQASGTSPAAVTFLTFDEDAYGADGPISMDFEIRGGGNTAIAIGLLAPAADFGDAPASYGDASHFIPAPVVRPDGLQAGQSANVNAPGFLLGSLLAPATGFLGSAGPDGESGSQYSGDARGDDADSSVGAREEDAWPQGYVLDISAAAPPPLSQTVACNGSGTVAGWIDFGGNGAFDASERAQAPCSGGSATLVWNVPRNVVAGESYVRLRYSSDANAVAAPTGEAPDGEVEDHALQIRLAVDLSLDKSVAPASAAVGQQVTYTLTVGNAGPYAADGAVVADPPANGLDCAAPAPVSCAASGGAQCPPAATVGDLQGGGLTIPALPADGGLILQFQCTLMEPTP